MVWYGWDGGDYEIFLYSDGVITQLTNNSDSYDGYPQINASGQVVWEGAGPDVWYGDRRVADDTEIFLSSSDCKGGKPLLKLSLKDPDRRGYWASYADYQARKLSVVLVIGNVGTGTAYQVKITGSTNTNNVTLMTEVPVIFGDIAAGGNRAITLAYYVPADGGHFLSKIAGSSRDSDASCTYLY